MENELDPRLQQMLKAYGAAPKRDPRAARRNQERFVSILNVIFEEQVAATPAPESRPRSTWNSIFNQLNFANSNRRRSILIGVAVLIVLAMFLFGGMGITAYAASSSLPGDPLYSLKTTVENVRAGLTGDSAVQARLYLEYAGRRLSEIQSLIDADRHNDVPQAAREFESDIQKALSAVDSLSQTDPARAIALKAEIAVALRIYNDILTVLLARIPGDIQPALQAAINASQSAAGTLTAGQDDDINHNDDGLHDEDDFTPSPGPSQTPHGTGTPNPSSGASETPQMTATPEPMPTASEPPPATLTAVPTAIPTSDGGSSVVPGADGTCQGFLGAVTVENLEVPQGASCTLDGTRVQGNIFVRNGASLTAQRVSVIGNIQAEGASFVGVYGSTVGGSIQIKQGGSASIEGVSVTGDIQFESNNGVLSAAGNQVGGNIQVFKNSAGITIANNVVNGNLQCKENNSAPTGGNNTVQGNKEDQCAGL